MTSGPGDIGEAVLREIEKAAGFRPPGCPWAALQDPYVRAVINAHHWHEKGELHLKWGHDPPHALMLGLEYFAAALVAVKNHDEQKRADEREREAKAAKATQQQTPRGKRPR